MCLVSILLAAWIGVQRAPSLTPQGAGSDETTRRGPRQIATAATTAATAPCTAATGPTAPRARRWWRPLGGDDTEGRRQLATNRTTLLWPYSRATCATTTTTTARRRTSTHQQQATATSPAATAARLATGPRQPPVTAPAILNGDVAQQQLQRGDGRPAAERQEPDPQQATTRSPAATRRAT